MNPLTQIKNTQKASKLEIASGFSEEASWHARFKHSAYIFAGGLAFGLTEGDLLAIFAQYGDIVDVNLVKDKDTGKSRGFAFVAYEDQRSTTLAVDNLSGARVASRVIRVEHVDNYKRKRAEMEGREPSPETPKVSDDGAAPPPVPEGATVADIGQARRGSGAGPADAPWMNSSSVFSLLRDEPTLPPPPAGSTAVEAKPKKEKKHKTEKDKKEKKEKKEHKEKRHKEKLRGGRDAASLDAAAAADAPADARRNAAAGRLADAASGQDGERQPAEPDIHGRYEDSRAARRSRSGSREQRQSPRRRGDERDGRRDRHGEGGRGRRRSRSPDHRRDRDRGRQRL